MAQKQRGQRRLAVALFGMLGGLLFFALRSQDGPPSPEPTVDMRRLFLENHNADDAAREYIFRGALRKSGQRCDSVTSHLMTTPRVWTVRCAPGYVYQFTFDVAGQLVGARQF